MMKLNNRFIILAIGSILGTPFVWSGKAVQANLSLADNPPVSKAHYKQHQLLRQGRTPRKLSTGTCGGGSVGDGICADGSCCSSFGWCGTTPEHCGTNQGKGTCGGGSIGDSVCADGTCCSRFGWCGTTAEHCSTGTVAPTTLPATVFPTQPPLPPSTNLPTLLPTTRTSTTPGPSQQSSSVQPMTSSPTISLTITIPPVNSTVEFSGISNAYSMKRGVIEVQWEWSLQDVDDNVVFDVFVSRGVFDFNRTLSEISVEELIEIFDNETTFQHHEINNGTTRAYIESTYYDEVHTILVTAQANGVFSSNKNSRQVVVSSMDPHVRDGVNVVGLFVPTAGWTIEVEDAPEGVPHSLSFAGAVSPQAQSLIAGDYITGLTSQIRPFTRRIVEVIQSTPEIVTLTVVHARIEEIFDELDVNGDLELSGRRGAQPGRRLFFGDFLGFVGDAVQGIGDAIVGVVEDVADTIVELVGGEALEEFTLVDISAKWEEDLLSTNNTNFESKLTATVEASFQMSMFANIRVAGPVPIYAEVGAQASYSAEAYLELSAGIGAEYSHEVELWNGNAVRRVILVGLVPVELYAQPKLVLNIEAGASLEVSSRIGASAQGGTMVSVIYDIGHNPALYNSFMPPTLETDYELPALEKEVSLHASAKLILSLDAGVYEGLLTANIGLSAGIGMDATADLEFVGD